MDIQGSDYTELRDLNAFIKDAKILLWDSFFFFAKQHNTLAWEFVFIQHLAVCSLLQSENLISI
jgi:hypothetical protein